MGKENLTRREFLEKTSTAMVAVGISGTVLSASQPLLADIGSKNPSTGAMSSELFDVAPFGRRCVADRNLGQVLFDYEAANQRRCSWRTTGGWAVYLRPAVGRRTRHQRGAGPLWPGKHAGGGHR